MWNPQSIYNQYLLRTPVLVTGREAVRGLYNYPCARIAIIHGSSILDKNLFRETFKKKDIRFFKRSWKGEPDLEGLSGTIHELEEYRPDTIIAMGGGSVIDGVKLCRLFFECPYYKPGITRVDIGMLTTHFIAVPTTIGSGTEVSSAAVYVDVESSSKQMVVMHKLQPDVIVYDDRYVKGAPKRLLCGSALDAFAHIVEGYVSNINNSIAETMAESGLAVLRNELRKIVSNHYEDIDFTRLQYAGYIGGIVQNHCIAGAAHAIAHQLTQFGFSHGEAVSLLLPKVIRQNMEEGVIKFKYERIASRTGYSSADEMAELIEELCRIVGIDARYDELKDILGKNVSEERFLANIKNDRSGKGNPVEINDDYINRLIGSM